MERTADSPSIEDLLGVYDAARVFLNEPTPERYLSAIDLSGTDANAAAAITKNWSNRKEPLGMEVADLFLPDVDLKDPKVKFVAFTTEGDWSAYYFLAEDPRTSDVFFGAQRFHKTNGTWKVAMRSYLPLANGYYDPFNRDVIKRLFLDPGIGHAKKMEADPTTR